MPWKEKNCPENLSSQQQNIAQVAQQFIAVWKNLDNEYLPLCLVTKILEHLPAEEDISHTEIISYLEAEKGAVVEKDGSISIEEAEHCMISNTDANQNLGVALKAVLGLIDKDNRQMKDDTTLYHLSGHLEQLFDNLKQYKIKWDIQQFPLVMKICHFYGLLGQSLIQGTNKSKSKLKDAMKVLKKAVQKIWMICDVGRNGNSLLRCQTQEELQRDALEYDESIDYRTRAEHIVKWCSMVSENIDLRAIDDYVKGTVKIHQSNYLDFLQHCIESGMASTDAEHKLGPVKTAVEQGGRLTEELLKVLRDTGNMLSAGDYRKVCLAEQIAANLHILARAVLYWKGIMTESEQRECEYYGKLAHEIAVKVREKTGVSLIHEYITKANFMVPRKLQTPNYLDDNSNSDRLSKLKRAKDDAINLLDNPGVMYECGKLKQIEGTPYTLMNAQKYIVKANCKMVGDLSETEKQEALRECDKLHKLAKENAGIAMSYNCCIQAMKGFAGLGEFRKAFEAFEMGFYGNGISTLFTKSIGTYVWALYNYTLCVLTYLPEVLTTDDLSKLEKAKQHCTMAIESCKVDGQTKCGFKDLRERLEKIEEKLHG